MRISHRSQLSLIVLSPLFYYGLTEYLVAHTNFFTYIQPWLDMPSFGYQRFIESTIESIFLLTAAAAVAVVPLFFLSSEYYRKWRLFALWYLGISVVVILFFLPFGSMSGFMFSGFSLIPRIVGASFLGILFIILSYLLTIFFAWRHRSTRANSD